MSDQINYYSRSSYTPIIMPRSKRYGNNLWYARGPKEGLRDIVLYSDLEFDHWVTVEANPKVGSYCEQPQEITFVINGKLRSSIFDMWEKKHDGSITFVEVKYEKELKSNHPNYVRTKRQIEAQREWCAQKGIPHEVRTEVNIRTGRHSIENKLKMISNVTNHRKPDSLDLVRRSMTVNRRKIADILEDLNGEVTPYDVLLSAQWMCYEGMISADLDNTIWGLEMEVWISEQNAPF